MSSWFVRLLNVSSLEQIRRGLLYDFFCTIREPLSEKIPRAKNLLLENDYEVNLQKLC